jgi:glycosyltransferase involved in cell wall biosynthesis
MKDNFNILCPTYWYPRSPEDTQATYVHDINRHLAKLGHRVTVVTPTQEKSGKIETFDDVRVVRFPIDLPDSLSYGQVAQSKTSRLQKIGRLFAMGQYARQQYSKAHQAATEYGADIVHAHWAIPTGPSAVAVAKRLSIPSIITMHGGDVYVNKSQGYDFPGRWYVKPFLKYVFKNVSKLTAISDDCKQHALAVGATNHQIRLIFNGADLIRFSPSAPGNKVNNEYGPHMIFACRQLFPRKGIAILLKAAAIARKEIPDLQVVIAGDGFQREELEQLSRSLSIADISCFLGWVANKNLPEFYRAAAISVIPSLEEGFGIPAAEAMGCELPVIASDAGGLPEVVDDGVTGFIVPKGEVEALAEKIIVLLKDNELRARMGKAGREKAVNLFSWDNTAQELDILYRELIKDQKSVQ